MELFLFIIQLVGQVFFYLFVPLLRFFDMQFQNRA